MSNKRGSFWWNLLKGADYGLATCFGIPAGIYISSYVEFKRVETNNHFPWDWCVELINWLFKDPLHCVKSLSINREDIKYYYGE